MSPKALTVIVSLAGSQSQLRAKVLLDLRSTRGKKASAQGLPISTQAAGLLFMDFLQSAGYMQTASVFSPETGFLPVQSGEREATISQLLELLRIHPDSQLGQTLASAPETSSMVKVIVEYLALSMGEKKGVGHSSCQTTSTTETLEKKFDAIHERYRSMSHDTSAQPLKSMQERLDQVHQQPQHQLQRSTFLARECTRSP